MEEVKKKQAISLPEVKEILEKEDPEKLDQIQRWTYDYVTKFSKTDASSAKSAKQKLVKECQLTDKEAVELINISPKTLAETHRSNGADQAWIETINLDISCM